MKLPLISAGALTVFRKFGSSFVGVFTLPCQISLGHALPSSFFVTCTHSHLHPNAPLTTTTERWRSSRTTLESMSQNPSIIHFSKSVFSGGILRCRRGEAVDTTGRVQMVQRRESLRLLAHHAHIQGSTFRRIGQKQQMIRSRIFSLTFWCYVLEANTNAFFI